MKKTILATVLVTPMLALAQAPGETGTPPQANQLRAMAMERLSKPVHISTTVKSIDHSVRTQMAAPNVAMHGGGLQAPPLPREKYQETPMRVGVHVPSRSGYIETPMGNCSLRFEIPEIPVFAPMPLMPPFFLSGPVNIDCGGLAGQGHGSWVVEPDGIHVHATTADGHEFNFKL